MSLTPLEILKKLAGAGMLRNKLVLAGATDAVVADVVAQLEKAGHTVAEARTAASLRGVDRKAIAVFAYLEDLGYDAQRSNDRDQIALLARLADLDPVVVCCRSNPEVVRRAPQAGVIYDIGGAQIRMDLYLRAQPVVDAGDEEAVAFALGAAFSVPS